MCAIRMAIGVEINDIVSSRMAKFTFRISSSVLLSTEKKTRTQSTAQSGAQTKKFFWPCERAPVIASYYCLNNDKEKHLKSKNKNK